MPRKDDDDLEVVELELTAEDVGSHEFASTDDGSPGRGIDRRWFVVGAIVVTVWLVVALVSQHRGAKTASTSATTSSKPATSTSTVPLPRFAAGPLYAGATGRFAIVAGGRLVIVDAATGRVRPVRGLPPGGASVVGRNGDSLLVVVASDTFIVDTRRDDTVRVDSATFPAVEPGRWWGIDGGRAVDARDNTQGNPNPIPDGYNPVAALRTGFLVHDQTLDTFEAWHPGTAPTPLIDNPDVQIFATHPDRVAWHGPCNDSPGVRVQQCTINVTDIASGRTTFVTAPQGGDRISGRFSPDGTALAMYAESGPANASVTIADVATGRITLRAPTRKVDSTAFSAEDKQPVPFDWDTDGRALFLIQGDDHPNLAIIPAGAVGARVHVTIPSLEQVLRLGTQSSPTAVALAPAPARPTTGVQIARVTGPPSGSRLDISDVDTGIIRRVALDEQIPQTEAGQSRQIVAVAGGFVVGNGREVFWVADGAARSLGAGENVQPGADEDEAWIASQDGTGYKIARVDGRTGAVGAPIAVRTLPTGVVRDGFVSIAPASFDRPAAIEVWNPNTRRTSRIDIEGPYPNVVAAWDDAVAWVDQCTDNFCSVSVTDVRTRTTRQTSAINGQSVYNQPGGMLYGRTSENGLIAYEMSTGTETPVPGGVDADPELVVSASGWVVFNTPEGGRAWRPGLAKSVEVAATPPAEATAAR